ncbi:zinc/manganese transport system permease protein [Sulfurivirga caldicuralii]|uniref:Zinc/manganese transport system permease protein n=1 Tax=Sulfurivirga caldicuralii TaxID=364032 RepID=A0A1N6GT83_9GAMM|nr:metal ABC transporter permease [Sulfurivirga caldicuralii]SIO10729.1 zinc/manganese transport system permease protein [Sulfurivirga caldicuralii]
MFDWGLLLPPFVAGALVALTHVPLGREVLARGVIFMDLAVAQIAALGYLMAQLLHWDQPFQAQAAAGAAALIGAGWLLLCERYWPAIQEALIGVTFVLASTASLLLLANNPHGGEHMRDLLSGQILWTLWDQLIPLAGVTVAVGLLLFAQRWLGRAAFYIAFALAVTASVQLLGVYLVFATLIVPAIAVRHLHGWRAAGMGYAIAVMAYALGLVLSSLYDLPAAPLIVWCIVAVALASRLIPLRSS